MAKHFRFNIGGTAVSGDIYTYGDQDHFCYYIEAKPQYSDPSAPQRLGASFANVIGEAHIVESIRTIGATPMDAVSAYPTILTNAKYGKTDA